jgi:serine protease Do
MPDLSRTSIRRLAIGAVAATALFAGFAVAPAMLSSKSNAAEIVIAPPMGAPMSFADLIERVSPAVVSISVRSKGEAESPLALQGIDPDDLPPGLEQFFKRGAPQQQQEQPDTMALGSGFFISETGTVVTNNHVIEGATEIKVKTSAGKEYTAELIGADAPTDLAVLKLKTTDHNFAFVKFDRDADLRVGDWVVAVGNPFGLEGTATAGIVSAKGRRDLASGSSYVDFIQTDAPINRGNSGGPTFDLKGRVVGVNSAIYSPSGGSVGIGFAIPSETAADVVDGLLKSGKITRGWLGVTVQPLDEDLAKSFGLSAAEGAMVSNVVPDGPADHAGVQQGDIILSVDGAKVADSRDLTRKVGALAVGRSAKLDVLRAGAHRGLTVKMAERPGEQQLASLGTRGGAVPAPNAPVTETKQAALGLDVRPITQAEREKLDISPAGGGLYISRLEPNASLARKGVRVGDVITEADGRVMRTGADLASVVSAAQKAKRPIRLLIESRAGPRYVAAEIDNG